MKLKKLTWAMMAVAGSMASWNASAQFVTGDLMLGFRAAGGSSSNLVVDVGPASTYLNATAPVAVGQFTAQQVTDTFGSLNNLYLSVFGYVDASGNPASLGLPAYTLFVTGANPLHALDANGLGVAESYLVAVANGTQAGSLGAVSLGGSVAREPSAMNVAGDLSYLNGIANPNNQSVGGNIHNTWPASIESATSGTFTTDTTQLVVGLFEYQPGSSGNSLNNPLGTLVGDFQLNNNGSLTFNPVPEPATWAMAGSGFLILTALRRLGKRSQRS